MIGNAQDDAAIAVRLLQRANSWAGTANRGMQGNLTQSRRPLAATLCANIAQSLGYDVNNGNLIQPVLPSGPQMSVLLSAQIRSTWTATL